MSPDYQECSLVDLALRRADINPSCCNSHIGPDLAKQCGSEEKAAKAKCYYEMILEDYDNGRFRSARVLPPLDGVLGSDLVLISIDEALDWRPHAPPIPAFKKNIDPERETIYTMIVVYIIPFIDKFIEKHHSDYGLQAELIRHTQELAYVTLDNLKGLSEPNLRKIFPEILEVYRKRKKI